MKIFITIATLSVVSFPHLAHAEAASAPAFGTTVIAGMRAACSATFADLKPKLDRAAEQFVQLNKDTAPPEKLRELIAGTAALKDQPAFANIAREQCEGMIDELPKISLKEIANEAAALDEDRRNAELIDKKIASSNGKRSVIGIALDDNDGRIAKVSAVGKDSPAQVAGILPGDVIKKFAGKSIGRATQLMLEILSTDEGQRVPVDVERAGKSLTLTLVVKKISIE